MHRFRADNILSGAQTGEISATERLYLDGVTSNIQTQLTAAGTAGADAGIISLAALPTAADKIAYSTAADVWAETTITAAGRALLDDANAAAQLVTLGAVSTYSLMAYGVTPATVGVIASGMMAPEAMAVTKVYLGANTLPNAGDAFSFNLRQINTGDLFSSNQVFARNPNPTGFAKTTDNEATFTSYITEVTGAGTAAVAIDTGANGDYLYVGFSDLFDGVVITMDGANVNAVVATMAAEYWNGSVWTALTISSDGTAAAGATLAQTGTVVWKALAPWAQRALDVLGTKHWARINVSALLTAGTAIDTVQVVRTAGHLYAFTPDQNLAVAAETELRLHITEADANAAGIVAQITATT